MQVKLVKNAPKMARQMRRPRLDLMSIFRPYAIVPTGFHPVLPGETLKNLWGSLTYVSDPLLSRYQAGWLDVMYFYVKQSQLSIAADLMAMHADGTNLPTATEATAVPEFYCPAGGVNFAKRCYEHVVQWYFRDADEALTPATGLIGGFQPAQIQRDTWLQSAKLQTAAPTQDDLLPGMFPEQPTENINDSLYTNHWTQWQRMRSLGFTDATYEDYLKDQGVSNIAANNDEERARPELIVRHGEFLGPVNAVEPSTGYPSTAHVKTLNMKSGKDIYFSEPGWIIGVSVWRPKIHYNNVTGSLAAFMTEADDWLPASLRDHPYTSLKSFNSGAGPAPVVTTGTTPYWVDIRDLLLYGEQQSTFAPNNTSNAYTARSTAALAPALPDANMNLRYLTETQARAVFLNSAESTFMRMDGVVSFDIASQIGKDTTL